MKVLLLSPPFVLDYMRNARCDFVSLSHTQWYPIWLGYCGALLEKSGHQVKFIDAPAAGLMHDEVEKIILDFNPDLLVVYTGLMSEDNDVKYADRLLEKIDGKGVFVGPYLSIDPEKTLNKSERVEWAIKGEFDCPVLEMADEKPHKDIQNLLYKENANIVKKPVRPLLNTEQLDAIPFVTRFFKKHLDFHNYKTPSEFFPYIDIMTGRGCQWGLCTYCLWVHSYIPGQVYNRRSIENIIEEFKYITTDIPEVRSVMIQDDTFTGEHAHAFSEAKIKSGIKIPWSCYARANLEYETLKVMKQAGCRNLHVGFESADPQILKNIKKGVSVERMTKFAEDADKAGLRIHGDFALGFNGETKESIQKTIDWACKMNPHTAQFQLIIPFPGTPYYDILKKNNWLTENREPDYPDLSNEEIRQLGKKAYRDFYLSWRYAKRAIAHPYEHFFGRLDTILKAIPAMFWKRW